MTNYFVSPSVANAIRQSWWAFFLIFILIVTYRLWPKKRFRFLIDKRDIVLEVVVGDIFNEMGPIIVDSNTVFDTDPTKISPRSVQGAFTNRFCNDLSKVDGEISSQVCQRPVKFGTTVVVHGTNDKVAYFCAIAELNVSGVAKGTMEDLRLALGGLWNYLANNAEKTILNIPILGSGFSRIGAAREELIREIVLSFMAAVSEGAFCDGLRLVLFPNDIKRYKINVQEIVKFVEYNCKYAVGRSKTIGSGTPEVS